MVSMEADLAMLFGGTDDALAYVELKSIGLPEDATADLSEAICGVLEEGLGVSPERIYIEFTRAERHRWGWNRRTFA